jgi:hypothetical protein
MNNKKESKVLSIIRFYLHFFVISLVSFVFIFALIMGSGLGLPLHIFLLQLAVCLVISAFYYFISNHPDLVKGWSGLIKTLLILAVIIINGMIFMFYAVNGAKHTLAYGGQLVDSVNEFHAKSGRWPSDLSEVPFDIPNDFVKDDDGSSFSKGRFCVHYELKMKCPQIRVIVDRDTDYYWNWDKGFWEPSSDR